jgi:hypothetical protein
LLLIGGFSLACIGLGGKGDDTGTSGGGGGGSQDIEPTSGTYLVELTDEESGDCSFPEPDSGVPTDTGQEPWYATFEISEDGTSISLTTAGDEGSDVTYDCPLDNLTFSCELMEDENDFSSSGFDAIQLTQVTMDGTWTDSDVIEGSTALSLSCEGEDCEEVAAWFGDEFSFPCSIVTGFQAELVE